MPDAGLRRQPRRHRLATFVVKTHAIDDGLLLRITKQTRLRVTRLSQRGHRADLNMAKSQRRRRRPGTGIFIEAGRHPDRVGESQAKSLHRAVQTRRETVKRFQSAADRRHAAKQGQRVDAKFVCVLRIHLEQSAAGGVLIK